MPHVFLCRSQLRPGCTGKHRGRSHSERTLYDAVEGSLAWVQYQDVDVRLDLVEGDYSALGIAFHWVRRAPDLLYARAEEWLSCDPRLPRGGFRLLTPRPHLRGLVRDSERMVTAAPDDLADLLAKVALVEGWASRDYGTAKSHRAVGGRSDLR